MLVLGLETSCDETGVALYDSEQGLLADAANLTSGRVSGEAAAQDAREVNPSIEVMSVSSLKGDGMDVWCNWLLEKVAEKKAKLATA